MTPITITHYVDAAGIVVDDRQVSGFSMRHESLDKAKEWKRKLKATYESGRAPTAWNGDRAKFAEVAMRKGYSIKTMVTVFD